PQIHAGNACLRLPDRGQAQQVTRQSRASSVISQGLCGETVSELVVPAILEKSPHGPDISAVTSAGLQTVTPMLPAQSVAALEDRVPGVHRRSQISVAQPGISLHVEIRRAGCGRPAEADPLNPQLGNDVIPGRIVFRLAEHSETRDRHAGGIDQVGVKMWFQAMLPFCAILSW